MKSNVLLMVQNILQKLLPEQKSSLQISQKTLQKNLRNQTKRNPTGRQKNLIFRLFCLRQIHSQALKSFLSLLICPLFLASCSFFGSGNDNKPTPGEVPGLLNMASKGENGTGSQTEMTHAQVKSVQNYFRQNCIDHTFDQGGSNHLYGINCLAGKQLVIQTSNTGEEEEVDSFSSNLTTIGSGNEANSSEGEEGSQGSQSLSIVHLDFIRPVYKVKYEILEEESVVQNRFGGKEYEIPLLHQFLSEREELYGSKDTKYHILFVLKGNYLVLYKASEDKNDIPYTERTSLEKLEKVTKTSTNSQVSAITRSYWISSPYEETQNPAASSDTDSSRGAGVDANIEQDKNTLYGVPWLGWKAEFCDVNPVTSVSGSVLSYFERDDCSGKPVNAQYIQVDIAQHKKRYEFADKKDLFPADFFDGTWFRGWTVSSSSNIDAEVSPRPAYLVRTNRKPEKLEFQDESGQGVIEAAYKESDYSPIVTDLKVKWKQYKMKTTNEDMIDISLFGEEEITKTNNTARPYLQIDFTPLQNVGASIEEIIVDKDWLSIVVSRPQAADGSVEKIKESFLRSSALNQKEKEMEQRRRFRQDHQHLFGILHSSPRFIPRGTENEEEMEQHHRMIHFNTNAEKEIKWYFSTRSPKGEYRALARKAVEIYNDAFQHISDGEITVTMASDTEDKDQGDFRYNIIHLIDRINLSGRGLLGKAPSFVNPDTGQIIGSSCNVNIEQVLTVYENHIKSYIRAKLFYPKKLNPASPYLQSQIEKQCEEVKSFINTKQAEKDITPSSSLNDREVYESCAKKISEAAILNLILHEMGHNFGLGHNFKASADEDNYYGSIKEMEDLFPSQKREITLASDEMPTSSSVMEYMPFMFTPVLTVLGKYDIAALRFLYMNEIEKSNGEPESLPSEWKDQVSLYDKVSKGNNYKTYFHCSDEVATLQEDYLCIRNDYGTTPLSIVKNHRDGILRNLERFRYRYDDSFDRWATVQTRQGPMLAKISTLEDNQKAYFINIVNYLSFSGIFLSQWQELKTNYLNSQPGINDETVSMYNIWKSASAQSKTYLGDDKEELNQSEKYLQAIQGGLSEPYKTHILPNNCFVSSVGDETPLSSCTEAQVAAYRSAVRTQELSDDSQKYDLLYEFREWLKKNIFKDWMVESMSCRIKHNESRKEEWINLEIIREAVSNLSQHSLYIEDCHSLAITEFLGDHGIDVIDQKGMENFKLYNQIDSQANDSLRWDVLPYSHIPTISFILEPAPPEKQTQDIQFVTKVFAKEPDFLSELKKILEDYKYIYYEGQSENDFSRINSKFSDFQTVIGLVDPKISTNQDITVENKNYFKMESYFLHPGHSNSFDYVFTRFLRDRHPIDELTKSPYLLDVYANYKVECIDEKKCDDQSLKDYLIHNGEFVVEVSKSGDQFIMFPYQRGSLAAKDIYKYKDLKRKRERIIQNETFPQVFKDFIIKSIENKLDSLLL